MADPTAVLGLLWTVATGIYDRIGSHHIGKSDLTFQLSWYKTYTTRDTYAMIDQAIRNDTCHRKAERLLELHKGVAKWLEGSGFRLIRPNGLKCPHSWTEQKATSFRGMIDLIDRKTEDLEKELRDALAARGNTLLTFAALPAPATRPRVRNPAAVTGITNAIQAIALNLGVAPNEVPATYV